MEFIKASPVSLSRSLLWAKMILLCCLLALGFFQVRGPGERLEKGENVCNYCREAGHWKSGCPVFRDKKQHAGGEHVKPAALAASIPVTVKM